MTEPTQPCGTCGMPCTPGEYHPYAACLMFRACHNSETVRANLEAVRGTPPAVAGEPEGWITWFRTPNGSREPIYSHGTKKPSHGAELDALLRKYPVFTTPQPTQAQAGAVPLTEEQVAEGFAKRSRHIGLFMSGVRFAEQHHGIKGGQHGL